MRLIISIVLAAWLGAGCESPFTSATLVEELRILAMKAQPPDLDMSGSVEFQALVADPAGSGREIVYTWAVCVFEFQNSATDIPCPGPGSFPLPGNGFSTTLSMPDLTDWLREQGVPTGPGDGEQPGELPIIIGLDAAAGDESVRGFKRIRVRTDGGGALNNNPVLTGLEVDGQPLGSDPVTLQAGSEHELRPLVADNSQELFVPEGKQEEELEEHIYSWFSTGGDFSNQRTILDEDSHGDPLDANDWTVPEEPGSYTLWLVVNDDRYGVDWLEFVFEVPSP